MIMLSTISVVFFYIFFKESLVYINFWSLIFTTISTFCLFIGSGIEVVNQKLIQKGKIKEIRKSNIWMIGIFFYDQALAFVFTSNIIYWPNKFFHIKTDI